LVPNANGTTQVLGNENVKKGFAELLLELVYGTFQKQNKNPGHDQLNDNVIRQ
jgi:hypothetical protein